MRSQTTNKTRAVENLDGHVEDVVELSSHDGCFYHFLNYSFWPPLKNVSTSQLSESTFSHRVCHDVVNNHWGHENYLCQGKR